MIALVCTEGAGAIGRSVIRDFSFLEEKKARVIHVMRNNPARILVALTKKAFVLAPKRDSAEEKASVKPPPRPDCIKMIMDRKIQTTVWKKIIKPISFTTPFYSNF